MGGTGDHLMDPNYAMDMPYIPQHQQGYGGQHGGPHGGPAGYQQFVQPQQQQYIDPNFGYQPVMGGHQQQPGDMHPQWFDSDL